MTDISKVKLTLEEPPKRSERVPFEVNQLSDTLQAAINDEAKKAPLLSRCTHFDDIVDGQYTHWQLHCAFDLVINKKAWKEPLSGIIDTRDVDIVQAAAIHFAGSPCDIVDTLDDNTVLVEGPGYYECIGS